MVTALFLTVAYFLAKIRPKDGRGRWLYRAFMATLLLVPTLLLLHFAWQFLER